MSNHTKTNLLRSSESMVGCNGNIYSQVPHLSPPMLPSPQYHSPPSPVSPQMFTPPPFPILPPLLSNIVPTTFCYGCGQWGNVMSISVMQRGASSHRSIDYCIIVCLTFKTIYPHRTISYRTIWISHTLSKLLSMSSV